ncbi:MAG: DUF3383 family protein [Candidatus Sericytochromatia bacterium]|nr:DUF3383 family protein [Candidatus Sericytochromatia bacterium]
MSGIERIIESALNLIAKTGGNNQANIPAIITDETPAVDGGFGAGYAKRYSTRDLDAVGDDFSTSGDTHKAASAIISQTAPPQYFYVIKRGSPTAGVVELVFDAALIADNTVAGTVNGTAISVPYGTSNAATLTAIAAAIQALPEVATAVSDGTDTITITFESQYVPAVGTFTVTGGVSQAEAEAAITTPAVTIQDDIANAIAETDTNKWFLLVPTSTNKGAALAAAAKVETLGDRKMLLLHSTEVAIYAAGSTDLASKLKALNYKRTGLFYHDDSTEMVHCALAGVLMGKGPGKIQASLRTLVGVTAAPLTSAQLAILEGKNCNSYASIGYGPATLQGVQVNGIDTDAIRDTFYMLDELDLALYNSLTTQDKVEYNAVGAQKLQGVAKQKIGRMEDIGVLDPTYNNTFTVPDPTTLSEGEQTAGSFAECVLDAKHLKSGRKIKYTANVGV